MSIFDTTSEWPDRYKACGAPHQSPVNLSRTFALPCERLCEWKVDEVAIQEAAIREDSKQSGGLMLSDFSTGTPTAKFNGEGYTCKSIVLFSSSQHSIENIFGEAEMVAYFTNPKGYVVCMSVLIRSAPGDSPSTRFFSSFVPYAGNVQRINLGNQWMLTDVIPETPSYYVYEGTTITPECQADVTWIVYSNFVTMDPSDYATLVRYVKPGRRPLQEVADRRVFFNAMEGTTTPAYAKKDGKIYMRCRKVLKDKEGVAPIVGSGLLKKEDTDTQKNQELMLKNTQYNLSEIYESIGGLFGIITLLFLVLFTFYLFFTSSGIRLTELLFNYFMYIPNLIHNLFGMFWPVKI